MQWYLQRVEGWEMPPSPSQELGTRVHSEMEAWLLEGKIPEHGSAKFITQTLGYLREKKVIVEEPKDYDMTMKCADVPVKGRIDVLIPPASDTDSLVVLDWKTSSNLRYAMTSDALSRDTQGVLYLEYAYRQKLAKESDLARFDHVYILTKGTGGQHVAGEALDRQQVARLYRGLEAEVEKMKATETTPVAQVRGSVQHCGKYGGCAFRDRCPSTTQVGLVQLFGGSSAGVEDMSKLSEILKARKLATGVVPPDAPAPTAPTAPAHPPVEGQAEKPEDKPEAWVTATTATVSGPVVIEQAEIEERPKSIIEVKYEGPKTKGEELRLFVDCTPDKGFEVTGRLEDEIAARTPSLLEHLRKTAPKDVPEGAVDLGEVLFGRGYAALSASFVVKGLSGSWLATSTYPASGKVLEVLSPKATTVVRGR